MRRLPLLIAIVATLAMLAGCGGSSDETTSGPAVSSKQQVRAAWIAQPSCRHPAGASRWGCSVGPYRCQAVVTGRGWSVSCSKPGESIDFRVRPS